MRRGTGTADGGPAPRASGPRDPAPYGRPAPVGPPADDHGGTAAGERWLAFVLHAAFFLLLGASLARFLVRHPGEPRTPSIIALSAGLALLQVLGQVLERRWRARLGRRRVRPVPRRSLWLGAVVAVWMVLVVLAPSFAWCAVPLFFTGLRTLPARAALALVAMLTAFVVVAQLRLSTGGFDPNLVLAPPAVAAIAAAVFVRMRHQAESQRQLIDDLIRTRRELAATERREGTLAERQRLSMEIHDTLAQGLSSQQMLLQAADRVWTADPSAAHRHVRAAASIAGRNLAEARRFVHDLAPADLVDGSLEEALRGLAARATEEPGGLTVRCHVEGALPENRPLPEAVGSALLRIAQGALANVREHAAATTATITLTCLDDQVLLDVADDGRGFDARAVAAPGERGHGLPAMRARARRLGGTLTVESAPGEGTVLSADIPLEPREPLP